MEALLFLNGNPPKKELLDLIFKDNNSFIACADGAYNYLKNYAKPDLLVGDFDSIEKICDDFAAEIIRLNIDKDITDGHYAIEELIRRGYQKIRIFGAFGGRLDQEYCNLSLLKIAYKSGVEAVLEGDECQIYYTESEFNAKIKVGSVISLAPMGDFAHISSTKGLKYPIFDEVFDRESSKGISNIAIKEEVGFKLLSGNALIFVNKES